MRRASAAYIRRKSSAGAIQANDLKKLRDQKLRKDSKELKFKDVLHFTMNRKTKHLEEGGIPSFESVSGKNFQHHVDCCHHNIFPLSLSQDMI